MLNLAAVTELTGKIPAPGFAGSQPRRSVAGAVAVITGGAAGIGRATAAELARLGATVVIGDLDADAADRTAEAVGAAVGRRLDVTDRPAFTAFLDEVEAEFGPLQILVNNAGVMPLGRIAAEDDATTERILQVNLHGVIHGTREAVQRMAPRGEGHIINLASTLGKAGLPGGATYCATKFAVVGFCESVRAELAGTGVELTVVLPGVVETSLGEGVKQPLLIRRVNPEDVARGIADAVQRPRFEVYVPFEAGPIAMLGAALPHSLRDRVARTLGLHETLAEADAGVRAAYEASVRLARAAG
jgi:NADP-dependent 3-hydroxy acid dehydrogenase YdfG